MFTGLVAGKGVVRALSGGRLEVETELAGELAPGDSIAVNGVCLTAVERSNGTFAADVMPETLRLTSLEPLGEGDEVNLELPLRAGDRLGGHVMQGHVDGISLTVAELTERSFTVSLIPETQERTNLGAAGVGQTVNLEVDVLAKYVERLMQR